MQDRYEQETRYYNALWSRDNQVIEEMLADSAFGPSYVFEDREDVDLSVLDIVVASDNLPMLDKLLRIGVKVCPTAIQYAVYYNNQEAHARLCL
jgi:hypothetical protein